MKKVILFVISLLLLLAGCGDDPPAGNPAEIPGAPGAGYQTITAEEAKQLMEEGNPYVLVDARTEAEYAETRIDGAILIPHTDIGSRAPEELPDKDKTIFVYCRAGVRSAAAAETLAQMGYIRVYDIGGIAQWPYETVSGDPYYEEGQNMAKLLYQGHGSLRLITPEGKVIYIDPYAGEGYDIPADLILVTHQHSDHNQTSLIASRNPGCEVVTEKEALKDGKHQIFDLGYVTVEATEAGNKNHDPKQCVGYILTLSDGVQVYISGDTSKTAQMETLAERGLDYAFLCCDGVYNMDLAEASGCAALIGARHSIPYHMAPGKLFDRDRAEQFEAQGRLIVADGEEITLNKE